MITLTLDTETAAEFAAAIRRTIERIDAERTKSSESIEADLILLDALEGCLSHEIDTAEA